MKRLLRIHLKTIGWIVLVLSAGAIGGYVCYTYEDHLWKIIPIGMCAFAYWYVFDMVKQHDDADGGKGFYR